MRKPCLIFSFSKIKTMLACLGKLAWMTLGVMADSYGQVEVLVRGVDGVDRIGSNLESVFGELP